MAIVYPLSLPTVSGTRSIVMRSSNAVVSQMSPFTYKRQVQEFPGKMWAASVTLPPMTRADAEAWVTFIMSLKGQLGTFLMGDPSGAVPRGSASTAPGTPVVDGAGQEGSSLNIRGAPASASGYLLAGDYIQLGGGSSAALFKVLVDVDTDVSGDATLELWPDITSAVGDGSTVTTSDTVGVFSLTVSSVEWSINQATVFGITFDATGVVI